MKRYKDALKFGVISSVILIAIGLIMSFFSCSEPMRYTAMDGHQFADKDLSAAWNQHLTTVREVENDCAVHGVAAPIDTTKASSAGSIGCDSVVWKKWNAEQLERKAKHKL